MKAPRFGYERPATLAEALSMLRQHGPEARLLAGGQSLLASLAFRLSEPSVLIDISRLAELKGVTRSGDTIRVGAGTTHTVLGADPLVRAHVPLIAQAIPHIAHPAIRNRGTIGGSLAFADPAAELPACCVALDARIVAASAGGERRIAASDFFTGLFSTALADGEMIAAVEFSAPAAGERSAIEEVARRSGDYAMAGVAVRAALSGGTLKAPRIVFFGVGDAPVVAKSAMATFDGKPASAAQIAAAKAALARDLDPPADQHGSSQMKLHLAGVVLARALTRLASDDKVRAA